MLSPMQQIFLGQISCARHCARWGGRCWDEEGIVPNSKASSLFGRTTWAIYLLNSRPAVGIRIRILSDQLVNWGYIWPGARTGVWALPRHWFALELLSSLPGSLVWKSMGSGEQNSHWFTQYMFTQHSCVQDCTTLTVRWWSKHTQFIPPQLTIW